MKDTTTTDFFYNIEDIRNLFIGFPEERYYGKYKLAKTFPLWTGECATKLIYFSKWKEFRNNE